MRYEPKFRYLWPSDNKPAKFTTEWFGQKTSWGILQIMGAVARERQFDSKYLSELCDLKVNLKLASEYLAELRGRSDGTWEGALAAYNGGLRGNRTPPFRNQFYVDKVAAKVNKFRRVT
jgi:soluble lytic murein transglycosylase-like protein